MLRRVLGLSLLSLVIASGAGAKSRPQPEPEQPSDPVAWTSYGYDNQLRNAVPSTLLTLRTVPRLAPAWKAELDGPVYASPLSARVDGDQVAYVATEAGSVYALAVTSGEVLWRRELGTTTTGLCGTWGITSTGAIDLARGLMYVIGATGQLHALSLATGEEATGYPRQVVSRPDIEYVWGGLRIARDRLYVPIASYCDVGNADGFPEGSLLAIPLDAAKAIRTWDPVPGPDNLGGMWGWGGVSIDPTSGVVYTGVGNSHVWSDECSCFVDNAGYGDRIVALSPGLARVLDSSELPDIPPTGDADFGAAALLFQPETCPPLAAANNKNGTLYILDRQHLSRGSLVSIPIGDGVASFVGEPAWSVSKQMIYSAQSVLYSDDGKRLGNGVRAFHVDPGCGFRPIWSKALGDGNQAKPLVVGNVLFATGGTPGGFYALDAADGRSLWSYATTGGTVAAMITVAGTVLGADTDGTVYAFRPPEPARGCTGRAEVLCSRRAAAAQSRRGPDQVPPRGIAAPAALVQHPF
jgi:outer membrane protein assembly factor BamB